MTSVFNNVTSWLGVNRERDSSPEGEREPVSNNPTESAPETSPDPSNNAENQGPESPETTQAQQDTKIGLPVEVQEVSEKALHTAKEWGSE